jgi:CPA1 family monovalent cation:H+ antiporter
MEVFEVVIALLLGGAALAAVARRLGAPYPALVALAGATPEDSAAPPATAADTDGRDADAVVVRAATEAQRRRLVALRADGTIGDAAFQRVEEELDWAELDWAQLLRAGQPGDGQA